MLCHYLSDAYYAVHDCVYDAAYRMCDYLYRLWYAMRAFYHLVRYRAEVCAVHPLVNCAPITSPSGLAPALVYCLIVRIPLASWQRVGGASLERINTEGYYSLAESTIVADELATLAAHGQQACRIAAYSQPDIAARQVA